MARIVESYFGETPFQRLLGHNKDVMEGWSQLGDVLEKDGVLTSKLKEQVRRTLAQSNGCEYCRAKGKPVPVQFDEKTSIANVLREYFSTEEISELCAFISFTTASQYFGAMMKLEPENN
ncbi:carboxymuconolactone decarboxylase family protein [Ureibacillus sp. NPDC094379]